MTMVALGGSITAGQGVTVTKDNYVERLYRWVQVRPTLEVLAYSAQWDSPCKEQIKWPTAVVLGKGPAYSETVPQLVVGLL